MLKDDMELEKICQNCGSFFQCDDDYDFGICMMDEEFEPYLDEIFNNENFSCCRELFLRKKINALTEACDQYEEVEFIDASEDMYGTDNKIEVYKNTDVSDVIKYLYKEDMETVKNALSQVSFYVNIGNVSVLNSVLEYYLRLGQAINLEDVHFRINILEMFRKYESDERILNAYIKELERTPSNNTTRQLYSYILERFKWCNYEVATNLLYNLLDTNKYGVKLQKRIIDTIENNYTIPIFY